MPRVFADEATIAWVGSPPLISRSGAPPCTTASSQARQALSMTLKR
jgi:hypothetical protein